MGMSNEMKDVEVTSNIRERSEEGRSGDEKMEIWRERSYGVQILRTCWRVCDERTSTGVSGTVEDTTNIVHFNSFLTSLYSLNEYELLMNICRLLSLLSISLSDSHRCFFIPSVPRFVALR